jgi:L-rhamnose-H+ transport protein
MVANPMLGVLLHAIGGLAAACFYLPYKKVRFWAWETYWLAGGVFAWLLVPWLFAVVLVPDCRQVLMRAGVESICWTYLFGVLWGIGAVTYGLTMRYLGIALGMAIVLGNCAAFGTLIPPLFKGQMSEIISTQSGLVILGGVGMCLAGIALSGMAGMSKERELSKEQKLAAVEEFSFAKGMIVAILSGILSAAMSYAFAAGKPIATLAVQYGTSELWQNVLLLPVVLAGGLTTNMVWCLMLNVKNKTLGQYAKGYLFDDNSNAAKMSEESDCSSSGPLQTLAVAEKEARNTTVVRVPMAANYLLCACAGTMWYLQFFFYGMGTTKMGKYDFSSWTLHMASIIIFGTICGIFLKEWRGTSRRTHALIAVGLVILISSTIVVGYGNYLGTLK